MQCSANVKLVSMLMLMSMLMQMLMWLLMKCNMSSYVVLCYVMLCHVTSYICIYIYACNATPTTALGRTHSCSLLSRCDSSNGRCSLGMLTSRRSVWNNISFKIWPICDEPERNTSMKSTNAVWHCAGWIDVFCTTTWKVATCIPTWTMDS